MGFWQFCCSLLCLNEALHNLLASAQRQYLLFLVKINEVHFQKQLNEQNWQLKKQTKLLVLHKKNPENLKAKKLESHCNKELISSTKLCDKPCNLKTIIQT